MSSLTKNSSPQQVFSGIRATGHLHLGNYLGAVKGFLELQNNPKYKCIFMAVDLHTITTPFNPKTLPQATKDIILDYLSVGLDPNKAIISAQSLVPQHTYLMFLFSSVMTVARMQHLPTFKEKATQYPQDITMALLNYPILMAADILVYKAELVPVGIDQEPHLEVAREVARKMNQEYGTSFPEPQRFATSGEYVPSLKGSGKMSKSVEGSYINLTDDLATIQQKLAGVPTDSGQGKIEKLVQTNEAKTSVHHKKYLDQQTQQVSEGVASLLQMVRLFQGEEKFDYLEEQYQGSGIRYQELKQELAQVIFQELEPIQEKRQQLVAQPDYIEEVILDGAKKAKAIAQQTQQEVMGLMGLGIKDRIQNS